MVPALQVPFNDRNIVVVEEADDDLLLQK